MNQAMTKEKAIAILREVSQVYKGTWIDHVNIQQALEYLASLSESPPAPHKDAKGPKKPKAEAGKT